MRELNVIERALMYALFVHLHHNIDNVIDFEEIDKLNQKIRKEFYPDILLIGPGDDAGVIGIPGTDIKLVGKMESHCSPCVVDPWGSAFTGGGGAIRDVVAMGARPLFLEDFVGLGPLDKKVLVGPCGFKGECRCGKCQWMTNQARLNLITKGVRDVCELMGVILLGGGLSTSLDGVVPAVVVAVVGELVTDKPLTKPFKNPGDSIILIGETDDDGNDTIFRAGLAKEMKPAKPLLREERTSMEAALAAIRTGLMHSLSDLGAAGIGAAVCEAAKTSGLGAEIELSKVPIKQGKQLNPAELILNETQARYSFTVSPENAQCVLKEIKGAGGVGTVIGEVKEDTKTIFRHNGEVVASISNRPSKDVLDFLKSPQEDDS